MLGAPFFSIRKEYPEQGHASLLREAPKSHPPSYSSPPESGFYYLKSRYYDPKICRFINADGLASTGQGFLGCNMFAYCLNNPVNGVDPSGCLPNVYVMMSDGGDGYCPPPPPPFINGQGRDEYCNIPFGDSTIGESGCGPIALYDLLLLLGASYSLDDVIEAFCRTNHFWLLDLFGLEFCNGISTYGFGRAMREMGIAFDGTNSINVVRSLEAPVAFVVLFRNGDGVFSSEHFVAIMYDGEYYHVYNRWNKSSQPISFETIEDAIGGEGRFHYAYIPCS